MAKSGRITYSVNKNNVEAFLGKYPKVKTSMMPYAELNIPITSAYKKWLKSYDDSKLGGRAEVVSSESFGTKTFYKFDWDEVGGWAEVFQYLYYKFDEGGGVEGSTGEEWVLYDCDTDEVISIHKNHRSAKQASNKLWNTAKYNCLGIDRKSEWDMTHSNYGDGGGYADGGGIFGKKGFKFRYIGDDGQVHGINYRLIGIKSNGEKEVISEHTSQSGAERKARIWAKTAYPNYTGWEIDYFKFGDGGGTKQILTLPKSTIDEIKESVRMGYNIVQVGMISPKRKGVMLMNDEYEVRGKYPLEYKEFIEQIIKGKYSEGGQFGSGGDIKSLEKKLKELESKRSNWIGTSRKKASKKSPYDDKIDNLYYQIEALKNEASDIYEFPNSSVAISKYAGRDLKEKTARMFLYFSQKVPNMSYKKFLASLKTSTQKEAFQKLQLKTFQNKWRIKPIISKASDTIKFKQIFEDGGEFDEVGGSNGFLHKSKEFAISLQQRVLNKVKDGVISVFDLTEIIKRTPNYPFEIVGNIRLKKVFLQPYYQIVKKVQNG